MLSLYEYICPTAKDLVEFVRPSLRKQAMKLFPKQNVDDASGAQDLFVSQMTQHLLQKWEDIPLLPKMTHERQQRINAAWGSWQNITWKNLEVNFEKIGIIKSDSITLDLVQTYLNLLAFAKKSRTAKQIARGFLESYVTQTSDIFRLYSKHELTHIIFILFQFTLEPHKSWSLIHGRLPKTEET